MEAANSHLALVQREPPILINFIQEIGSGSFGTVHKAEVGGQICAVKHLQQQLHNKTLERFKQECKLLTELRHGNVVQCLGTILYRQQPVLVMELMDCNLRQFLLSPIRYYIQVNILTNIVNAIAYLHRCGVIHRDLSSTNVLMKGYVAKVTDFGMARLVDADPSTSSPLTGCPGTKPYMPPEALVQPPHYTSTIDIFSVGVLAIQILTGKLPNPIDKIKVVNPGSKICELHSEIERRKEHIDQCENHNPLKQLALLCLEECQHDRPSATQLHAELLKIQGLPEYQEDRRIGEEGMQLAMRHNIPQVCQAYNNQVKEIDHLTAQVEDLNQARQLGEQEIIQLKYAQQQSEEHLTSLVANTKYEMQKDFEQHIQNHNQVVEQIVDKHIQQMRSQSDGEKKQLQAEKDQLQAEYDQLQAEKCQDDARILQLEESVLSLSLSSSISLQDSKRDSVLSQTLPSLSFQAGADAPMTMHRWSSAVTHDGAIYMTPGRTKAIYKYTYSAGSWTCHGECQAENSTLAFVQGTLVTVGGKLYSKDKDRIGNIDINILYSLCPDGSWTDKDLPPMQEPRHSVIAVTSGKVLIVAGGCRVKALPKKAEELQTVEIYRSDTKQWQYVSNLPFPLYHASVTICGNSVFILGPKSSRSRDVLTCQLTNLVTSSQYSSEWTKIEPVPLSNSTCATLKGHLLAIGGNNFDHNPSNEVFRYDEESESWCNIGYFETAREQCFAAVISSTLFVIGGSGSGKNKTLLPSIEIGTLD